MTTIWDSLTAAAHQPEPVAERELENAPLGLWAWLKEKLNLASYRPEAAPDLVVRQLAGREGDYYVLKNPLHSTYFRLSGRDYFLWQRMDGTRTVKDLVVAYFMEYGAFAFARVAALVQDLKAGRMLVDQPVGVYRQVRTQLARRQPGYRLDQVWRAFQEKSFAIRGIDGWLSSVYHRVGWLFYTRPAQLVYLLVAIAGLICFALALRTGGYGVVTIRGSLLLGVIGLFVAQMASIFVHEMAHALTVKHSGRTVRSGGFLIYFGLPGFFVDTTDIWLEGKRSRLAVTWSGPYSGLILGGLAGIVLILWPGFALNPLLFQFALVAYITVFLNLNPLLELDGYYLLMDWLEIPMLRRKSLEFVRSGLWAKLQAQRSGATRSAAAGVDSAGKKEAAGAPSRDAGVAPAPAGSAAAPRVTIRSVLASLSREEKIFTVFGLLSAAWTLYAIYLGAYFWQQRLVSALRDLWSGGGGLTKIVLAVALAAISLLFVLSIALALVGMARKAVSWAVRRGLLANSWLVAALLLVVSLALAALPIWATGEDVLNGFIVAPAVHLLALGAAAFFSVRNAVDLAGAKLARPFWLLALLGLLLLMREAVLLLGTFSLPFAGGQAVAAVLGILAAIALFLAGLSFFAETDRKQLRPIEKVLLGAGLLASVALLAAWVLQPPTPGSGPVELVGAGSLALAALLTLTLLLPTLLSHWQTNFAPAWLTLMVGLVGLAAATLLGLPPALPYLLLAAAPLLHHLALRHAAQRRAELEPALGLSDRQRLQRAFAWTVAAIFSSFREIAGVRAARAEAERLNRYALASSWPVRLDKEQAQDSLPADWGLLQCGGVYAAALNLLLDLVSGRVGDRWTVRALQRAYDGLPWEEREVGGPYLFREVGRAAALSQEFEAARQDYRGLLQRLPLLATMDDAELDLLLSRLKLEQFGPGQTIIRQGAPGDRFYILHRGHIEVTQRDERGVSQVVDQLDRGDYFGEIALLRDAPRNATCRATVPSELLSLSRDDFDHLVKARFDLREKVDSSLAQAELLRRTPLFAELDRPQLQSIAAKLRLELYEPGEPLIRQGEVGEAFYVIESGRVQVSVARDGQETVLHERGPGEYVGEIALLLNVLRTATVRALTPTRVWALYKEDFDRLVAQHLLVSRALEREASRRMRNVRQVA